MILIRRDLAERKRQVVRDELSHIAAQLIARDGFEETTVDQIVAAAGVSRRTFFRYFKSKEDVIVEVLTQVGEHACGELVAALATESPAAAVRHALGEVCGVYREFPEKSLALSRLITGTPALRARYLDRHYEWRQTFTAELARRSDDPEDLRHALLVATAFAAFDVALTAWTESDGARDLKSLLDEALARVSLDTIMEAE